MRVQKVLTKEFQFYLADLDNIVLVKCDADGVVTVKATRGNCSEERKVAFIRRLATEGFIPDEYQWLAAPVDESKGIRWVKDYSWLEIPAAATKRSNRFMLKLLLAAGLIWMAMMRILVVSHPGQSPANSSEKVAKPAAIINGSPGGATRTDSLVR